MTAFTIRPKTQTVQKVWWAKWNPDIAANDDYVELASEQYSVVGSTLTVTVSTTQFDYLRVQYAAYNPDIKLPRAAADGSTTIPLRTFENIVAGTFLSGANFPYNYQLVELAKNFMIRGEVDHDGLPLTEVVFDNQDDGQSYNMPGMVGFFVQYPAIPTIKDLKIVNGVSTFTSYGALAKLDNLTYDHNACPLNMNIDDLAAYPNFADVPRPFDKINQLVMSNCRFVNCSCCHFGQVGGMLGGSYAWSGNTFGPLIHGQWETYSQAIYGNFSNFDAHVAVADFFADFGTSMPNYYGCLRYSTIMKESITKNVFDNDVPVYSESKHFGAWLDYGSNGGCKISDVEISKNTFRNLKDFYPDYGSATPFQFWNQWYGVGSGPSEISHIQITKNTFEHLFGVGFFIDWIDSTHDILFSKNVMVDVSFTGLTDDQKGALGNMPGYLQLIGTAWADPAGTVSGVVATGNDWEQSGWVPGEFLYFASEDSIGEVHNCVGRDFELPNDAEELSDFVSDILTFNEAPWFNNFSNKKKARCPHRKMPSIDRKKLHRRHHI
jgi:hypothetical protein